MLNTKEEIYYTVIIITAFAFVFVVIIITTSVLYYNRKKSYLTEKSKFNQILLQAQLEIKEQTMRHIAHELHDNLGQIASLIKINLNTLQLSDLKKGEQKIEDTKELVRQLITDLKSLSISLNGERTVQMGIVKSIELDVERLNKTGQFEVSIHQEGYSPTLDNNTTIIVYRMVQEILNNMVKHSGAKQIKITLNGNKNLLTLVCSDDGVGFNKEEKMNSGGSGLLNLQNRAKLINAQLTIRSSAKTGTTISIELPL